MRRGLPRKTDLATLSNQRLLSLVRSYNHTPRKCLNYKTPAEVFCRDLLHFKCESTRAHCGARPARYKAGVRQPPANNVASCRETSNKNVPLIEYQTFPRPWLRPYSSNGNTLFSLRI